MAPQGLFCCEVIGPAVRPSDGKVKVKLTRLQGLGFFAVFHPTAFGGSRRYPKTEFNPSNPRLPLTLKSERGWSFSSLGRQRVFLIWYQATTRSILFHTRRFPPVPAASSSARFSQSRRLVLWLSRIEPSGRAPKGHSILAVPTVLKALLRPSCICRAARLQSLELSAAGFFALCCVSSH